jgi:ABC-2 type transport system permease protein
MNRLRGTSALTGLALRRDRFKLAAYILGPAALTAGMLALWRGERHELIVDEVHSFATTPALRLFGVASGASVGGVFMIRGYLLLAVLAALMSTFTIIRHTRQNEELGRAELVGAAVVGRHAGLAAASIVAIAGNLALAATLALIGIANGLPAAGSLMAGLAVGAFGVVFAAVAAVTAQLSSTTRGASGLAAAVLGVAFAVSGLGNMLGHADAGGQRLVSAWPVWLSPLSWGQQMRPFGGDNPWPLGLFATAAVLLLAAASVLATQRDVGRGILADRRGNAVAAPSLLSPLGLLMRLQRAALLGWAAGLIGFGLIFGAVIEQVPTGATAEWYTRMGGSDQITDAYCASMLAMAGMTAALYAVQVMLRLRAEEADGRLEPILATAISRRRWLISHILNAGLGALLLLLVFATSMGLTAGLVLDDVPGELRTLLAGALVQLPGTMVIIGLVVAADALLPRWATVVSWTAVTAFILLGPLFGAATFRLPRWAQDLSPFSHIPKVPAVEFAAIPVASLVALASVLAAAGLAAFRRRNLTLPV